MLTVLNAVQRQLQSIVHSAEQTKQDLENKIEYELQKAKDTVSGLINELVGKSAAIALSKLEGDYYRADSLSKISKEYKYLREPLAALERLCFADFEFNRGLRWVIGAKPGSAQLDAIEGIYRIIEFINRNNDQLGGYDAKDKFIKAIADCENADKKAVCQILKSSKFKIDAWSTRGAQSGIYANLMDIVDALKSAGKKDMQERRI